MFRQLLMVCAIVTLPAHAAWAAKYTYLIDHGTPGVIASESKMARLVILASGDCAHIPYEVIADGVKSLSGKLNLSKPVSLPLDLTNVRLSCSAQGVTAAINP